MNLPQIKPRSEIAREARLARAELGQRTMAGIGQAIGTFAAIERQKEAAQANAMENAMKLQQERLKLLKESRESGNEFIKNVINELDTLSDTKKNNRLNELRQSDDPGVQFAFQRLGSNEDIIQRLNATKRQRQIDNIIEAAKTGKFTEKSFDEALKSADSTKLKLVGQKTREGFTGAESTKFAQSLRKEFTNAFNVKNANEVNSSVNRMTSVWNDYVKSGELEKEPEKRTNIAMDQVLGVVFQKMLDPDSVVRESEFARTKEGLSLVNKMSGFLERMVKGGIGLTDVERKELVRIGVLLAEKANEEAQAQVDFFNREANVVGIDPNRITGGFKPLSDIRKNVLGIDDEEEAEPGTVERPEERTEEFQQIGRFKVRAI